MIKSGALPKETWVGLVSSLMEAYNMAIYSFSAPLLARWMFRDASMPSALFFSYSLVLIGSCFLYPAGALVYGFLGDKIGRQKICTHSTLGLALATGMMALVPFEWTYFLLLICIQHFFSGGEYQGSIVFAIEHAQREKNGALSALSCFFSVCGLCAASGLATLALLTEDPLWMRSSFLVGALGGLLSYLLKNHCRETPVFSTLSQVDLTRPFLRAQWKKICGATIVFSFFIAGYSFLFLFLPLVQVDRIRTESFDTFQSLLLYGLLLVIAGYLADRIGMRK
ncbi:MAG: MFS transporter, partial [Chlamydiota bacterium]